jgi:hypothetical protein
MAPSGRTVASAALIGTAALLFVPVFADAAAGIPAEGYGFGGQLETIFEYVPLLLAAAGVGALLAPLLR